MRRLSLVLAFVLGALIGGGIVQAVNFTIVLTQAQVDIATWKWNQVDPSHVQYATAQLFGASVVTKDLDEFMGQRQVYRINIVGSPTGYFCTNTWAGLSQGTKDTICTGTLGDVNGCTPCSTDGS